MAKILHGYTNARPDDQAETLKELEAIRQKYNVIDGLTEGFWGYHDFLAKHWGRGDVLITIEMDKVATLADIEELLACARTHCQYPYNCLFEENTSIERWRDGPFIQSLGCSKFSVQAQEAVPKEDWYKKEPWDWLDRYIMFPMNEKLGRMHLHEHLIKHNHTNWEYVGPNNTVNIPAAVRKAQQKNAFDTMFVVLKEV